MDLSRCQQVIVFGGSFDPPHVAHARLPQLARVSAGADVVAYVPAAQAPHKRDREQTPAHHRLAMLRLALQDEPRAVILTDELDRAAAGGPPPRPSYTVDTLEALHARLGPRPKLRLLIGADQVRIFPSWRQWRRIIELAEPLVMLRPPETREGLLGSLPPELVAREWAPRLVELPALDVSSTEIRRRVAAGEGIAGLVMPAVDAYIREHGLYRG